MKKFDFKEFGNRLKSAFGGLRLQKNGQRKGLAPLPGTANKSIDWEKIYRKSFLYNSIAIVICAYFVADLAIQATAPFIPLPQPPKPRLLVNTDRKDISRFDTIYARNLFNERGLIPDNDDTKGGFDGPPVKSSLPLTLLGVIVVRDELKSVASVEDKGANAVKAVRVNDPISSGTQVQKIENNRVIFINRNTERREYIELPLDPVMATRRASAPSAGAGIVDSGNNRFAIDRQEVDKTLGNLNEVLTQARCVPNMEAGRPAGYRCFQIVPGSIYDKLGMKDNDVICGINGEPINDPSKAFSFLTALKESKSISLCINRNGQVMNMNYDIN